MKRLLTKEVTNYTVDCLCFGAVVAVVLGCVLWVAFCIIIFNELLKLGGIL